jgi:hypothetical protein
VDSEIAETERAGSDGSLASADREGEYVRGEFVVGRVNGQATAAVEHDEHDVDFVIHMRANARSRIEMYEVDVQVVARVEAPVDAVSAWVGATNLIDGNDGRGRAGLGHAARSFSALESGTALRGR